MIYVTVIVSHYGEHWRSLPVVGHHDDRGHLYMFVDHRTKPQARQDALRATICLDEINAVDVEILEPPRGCDVDEHTWTVVRYGAAIVASRCETCGRIEQLAEPYRGEISWTRHTVAAGF